MTTTAYYPEMQEKPRNAMIHLSYCLNKMSVKWNPENDSAVMAAFKRLRIRPTNVNRWTNTKGIERCSCLVTFAAADKLESAADCEIMILLD